ncbi:Beta-catenin-like protein 1 [Galdieria sulphuraria]|nr:Beta-catenin-like protein 1 [Galdieria sulphuraria]
MPLWKVAGFSLGALTAMMGEKAAMACTVAVEEVISQHYNDQIRTIHEKNWQEEQHLKQTLREFRDDEMEHHDTGIEYEAESFAFYRSLTRIIQWGFSVRKLSHQLEQAIKENTQQRSKYPDEPLRFEDSEVALDKAIQDFRSIASFPELFDKVQIWPSLVGLLGHENIDIIVDVIHTLNDFCEGEEGENLQQWIETLVQCGLLSGLISAMERLDLSSLDEASGFYSGLGILENILELNPAFSKQLAKDTNLFLLLTQYLNPSISSISLYCSEILAVVLQENDEIREYFGQLGLMDNILKAIAPYRKHKVNESDLLEMVENLFDCLCSLLFVSSNKDRWIQLEGIRIICLDFAMTHGPLVGKRFIQLGGLGILFAMFCEKSKKSSLVLTSQDTEHIVSILYFLFQYSDEKHRLMKKFIENDYEKLKRLILLHKKYLDKMGSWIIYFGVD